MIETIMAFFAVGSLGFFLFMALLTIVYTVASECDNHILAILATIVGVILYKAQILALILNWKLFLICFLIYGLVGGGWSIFRWYKFCNKVIAKNPYAIRGEWEKKKTKEEYYKEMLNPSSHKSQLTKWIIYWPFSLVWNVVGDFFTAIRESLAKAYQRIMEYIVNKAIKKSS